MRQITFRAPSPAVVAFIVWIVGLVLIVVGIYALGGETPTAGVLAKTVLAGAVLALLQLQADALLRSPAPELAPAQASPADEETDDGWTDDELAEALAAEGDDEERRDEQA